MTMLKLLSAWHCVDAAISCDRFGRLAETAAGFGSARRGLFSSALSSLWIWDTPSDLRDAIIKMNGSVNHKIVE